MSAISRNNKKILKMLNKKSNKDKINRLGKMKFWTEKHNEDKSCCFQCKIGWTLHPNTNNEYVLTPDQIELVTKILSKLTNEEINESNRLKNYEFTINNGVGMDVKEIILRLTLYLMCNRYAEKMVAFVSLANFKSAQETIKKFKTIVPDWMIKKSTIKNISLVNGSYIKAFSSNPNALRGFSGIGLIIINEVTHRQMSNNAPFRNTIIPISWTDRIILSALNNYDNEFLNLVSVEKI